MIALGVALGLSLLAARASPRNAIRRIDQGILVLLTSLAGSRVGYVILNWTYYTQQPQDIMQIWLGGLSGMGAVFGFLAGLCLVAYVVEEPLAPLADSLIPLGVILAIAAWMAAWLAGSAYGQIITNGFGIPAVDEAGVWAPRFPTQLLGALLTLALWVTLEWSFQRVARRVQAAPHVIPAGLAAALTLLGISVILLALSFTRADPLPTWRGLRPDTWAAIGLTVLGLIAVVLVEFYRRQAQKHLT